MNEALRDNLKHAFEVGRPAQGYIIVGPVRGEGQALAEWIGTQLLGESPVIAEHAHPDMPWFEPEKKSRVIGVEMMRERILPMAQQSSLSGGWKIPVIVAADRMNASAANAFLKTLEEPPPQTLFLLLVDALTDLLPTILSRCQVLHAGGARRLAEPWRTRLLEMLSGIEKKSVLQDTCRAEVIAEMLDEMTERAEKDVRAEGRANRAVELDADTLSAMAGAQARAWRADLLLTLEQWMRDLVRLRSAPEGSTPELAFGEYREALKARSKQYSLAKLLENLSLLETLAIQLERNLPPAQILPYWMDRFYL